MTVTCSLSPTERGAIYLERGLVAVNFNPDLCEMHTPIPRLLFPERLNPANGTGWSSLLDHPQQLIHGEHQHPEHLVAVTSMRLRT